MMIEHNIKAALLAHAQLLVEQQRVKEARQPDNWSVLIDAMMQWEPFNSWVAAGQLTREQMESGLQEALTHLLQMSDETVLGWVTRWAASYWREAPTNYQVVTRPSDDEEDTDLYEIEVTLSSSEIVLARFLRETDGSLTLCGIEWPDDPASPFPTLTCPCVRCENQRKIHEHFPDKPWLNPHRFDYLHSEDETTWTFVLFCLCWRCKAHQRSLRYRVIAADSTTPETPSTILLLVRCHALVAEQLVQTIRDTLRDFYQEPEVTVGTESILIHTGCPYTEQAEDILSEPGYDSLMEMVGVTSVEVAVDDQKR
jgi:hypothetical protein